MKIQEVDGEAYHTIETLQDIFALHNRGATVVMLEPWKEGVTRLTVVYRTPGMASELQQYYCPSSLLEDFVLARETEAKKIYDQAVKDAETWWPPRPKERTGT